MNPLIVLGFVVALLLVVGVVVVEAAGGDGLVCLAALIPLGFLMLSVFGGRRGPPQSEIALLELELAAARRRRCKCEDDQ